MSALPVPAPRRVPVLSWFRDRGVNAQIVSAVLVGVMVSAAVGTLGISALSASDAETTQLYEDNYVGFERAAVMRRSVLEMRTSIMNQFLAGSEAETAEFEQGAMDAEATVRTTLAEMRAADPGPAEIELLDVFEASFEDYVTVRDTGFLPAGRDKDVVTWRAARDGAKDTIATMSEAVAELVADEKESAQVAVATSHELYASSRTEVLALLAVGIALALGLGLLVARSIVGGLSRVHGVCNALERGDLTVSAGLTTADEVGRMGTALDAAVGSLRELVSAIDASSGTLASATVQMSGTSAQIAASAEETASQAGVVSAAAEQVSRSVQTVAAGTEQMGASIGEIAHNASQAAQVAGRAVEAAAQTTDVMNRLGDSSREIGNVVKVITSIAEQTNLLALNATIEAARAGEAGKGFAVVAGEVKELAQETARATEDIARRIEGIQVDTTGAVTAIEQIAAIIASINNFQMTIASAVEEQTATTNEITRSVAEAATGSTEIASNIASVATAAGLTTQGVGESQQAVVELAQMSTELKTLVSRFTA